MRVGEVSELMGLSSATLRYYEREGLLKPVRRSGGKRCYSADDLTAIRLIKAARSLGFGIADLKALGASAGDKTRRNLLLARKLARTQADLAQLTRRQEFLNAALKCPCDGLITCAVLG